MYQKNMEISFLFDFYGDILTDKQREAIDYYYNNDLSLAEIAEHSGISRQGVRDAIKRAEMTLLEMEDKLGLAVRFREMKDGIEQIRQSIDLIDEENKTKCYSAVISKQVAIISAVSGSLLK